MTNFFLNALGTFNIATGPNNPNGTHFAIIQVPGDNWNFIPGISASFYTITSYNQLKTAFANAFPNPNYDPPQGTGQNLLQAATSLTVDPNVLNSGYRFYISNHLVIYATTSSTPNTAAISIANSILANGTYSFMALGYQAGSNLPALASYVGGSGCVYSANDTATLNSLADKLANQIFDASESGGKYNC
uniref:Uncharacterized protein n=1 Tax=Acrobeloides nanus TaxID=290746 RepID=A0A914CD62_9BILA